MHWNKILFSEEKCVGQVVRNIKYAYQQMISENGFVKIRGFEPFSCSKKIVTSHSAKSSVSEDWERMHRNRSIVGKTIERFRCIENCFSIFICKEMPPTDNWHNKIKGCHSLLFALVSTMCVLRSRSYRRNQWHDKSFLREERIFYRWFII